VRTAFEYSVARNKRYRLLESGNEEQDHVPTLQELSLLKLKMYAASQKFKKSMAEDGREDAEGKRDKTVEVVKQ